MKFITKPFLIVITGCTLLLVLSACNTSTVEQNTNPLSNSSSYSTSTSSTSDTTFGVKAAQVNVRRSGDDSLSQKLSTAL